MQALTPLPDFDELAEMAQQNPDQLEALRLQMIEETISQAEEHKQRKLRGLQFHIDMEIRRAKSPMAACIKISEMMHHSLQNLRASLTSDAEQANATSISSKIVDTTRKEYSAGASGTPTSSDFGTSRKSAKLLMFPVI